MGVPGDEGLSFFHDLLVATAEPRLFQRLVLQYNVALQCRLHNFIGRVRPMLNSQKLAGSGPGRASRACVGCAYMINR